MSQLLLDCQHPYTSLGRQRHVLPLADPVREKVSVIVTVRALLRNGQLGQLGLSVGGGGNVRRRGLGSRQGRRQREGQEGWKKKVDHADGDYPAS